MGTRTSMIAMFVVVKSPEELVCTTVEDATGAPAVAVSKTISVMPSSFLPCHHAQNANPQAAQPMRSAQTADVNSDQSVRQTHHNTRNTEPQAAQTRRLPGQYMDLI